VIHILADGVTMHYEVHGEKDNNKTIVLLNGLSQATLAWTAILPALVKDHRIILLDLVFQGQSGVSEKHRSFDEHANDVCSLLNHLDIIDAIICGISYGGAVAQHLAVNHPSKIKGLILVSTFSHKTPHFNAIGDSWVSALNTGGYPLMLDVMLPIVLGEDYFENPLIPIATLKQMRIGVQPVPDSLIKLMKATEERLDYRPHLKQIEKPVVIIHGEKDLLIPVKEAREIQNSIKDSTFRVIEKAGHTLNLEAIPQLSGLIREFSESV
jgi:3-oxoadipate enol-lactonase